MRTAFKVCLINFAIAIVMAILFSWDNGSMRDLGAAIGLTFLVWGALSFFVCLVIFIMGKSEIGKGILLSAVLLVLIGFAVCSSAPFNVR